MLLCCMKTIRDVFAAFHHTLDGLYGSQEVEAITLLVISEISDLSRAKIKAFPEDDTTAEALEKLPAILAELQTGKPVQYILGSIEFYGLPFLVNPSVLIPRPETEELVDWVLKSQTSGITGEPLSILDIGTGSGCIAISLKKNLPDATVRALDISKSALDTAKQNAVINGVDINFIKADILKDAKAENPKSEFQKSKFNIIVSNPPYVTPMDKTRMHANVTDFEPHSALFVPQDDPLLFYKAIADYATTHLHEGGLLFFEINEAYGKDTVNMLADKGLSGIGLRRDISGRDRMICATYT